MHEKNTIIIDSNIVDYSFVVLDLETTGLDTVNDSIIEIAAIRFQLRKDGENNWEVIGREEKSMLINPEKQLTEEISLITHITDDMLVGKSVWEDVRERVKIFIGESIIVGHNVLFDVAMLKTHGINLEKHIILDTFELSEFFSTESESLNLGFLGNKYGIKTEKGEHRALGDVEICLGLLLRYMNLSRDISETEKSILRLIAKKEVKKNIGFFLEIIGGHHGEIYTLEERIVGNKKTGVIKKDEKKQIDNTPRKVVSLSSEKENEIILLKRELQGGKKTHIITTGIKISQTLKESLESVGYSPLIGIRHEKWCSIQYLHECIDSHNPWERKLSILIGRILIWLKKTDTGLLSEIKLYGKEYEYIDNFRMEEGEHSYFRDAYNDSLITSDIVIFDAFDYIQSQHTLPEYLIVKDIGLIDDKLRRALSKNIDITGLINELETLLEDSHTRERLIHALSLIKHIYEGIPDRPKGKDEFPPGEFGETYFFNQSTLWNKGGIWLLVSTRILESYLGSLNIDYSLPISEVKRWKTIQSSLEFLVSYHIYTSSCTSIIIEIGGNGTMLRFIPRYLDKNAHFLLNNGATQSILLYGYGIDGTKTSGFLENELGIYGMQEKIGTNSIKELVVVDGIEKILMPGSVILTTSMKHIRELGKICEQRGFKVLMQGISGGKGKILSIFEQNRSNTILVGLIDTWKDEYELWKIAKNLIIAKLPFDPPSDPYYLARTVGMSNNFSLYSEPMVIIRINTLIGYIRSIGFYGKIYTLDIRLSNTPWGTGIAREIL